jgi:hypothetical protein
MSAQITLADVQRWRNLPHEQRTSFYLEYARLTGSEQAMQQASISQFSGAIGGAALVANYFVKLLAGNYPDITISEFSRRKSGDTVHI